MPYASKKTADLADSLLALFSRKGYQRAEPPILQPIDAFLDLSGEEIRRQLFLTQDAEGNELCLRPDYTIPVSCDYLSSYEAGSVASLSYLGCVFRQRGDQEGEFLQGGIESFGRLDRAGADAEILALGVEALGLLGVRAPSICISDIGLFNTLLDALNVLPQQRRHIIRSLSEGRPLSSSKAQRTSSSRHAPLLAALVEQDPKAARAFLEDILSIAGVSHAGGRSVSEIAERFLAQSADQNDNKLTEIQCEVLERYLAIEKDPDSAASAIRELTYEAQLNVDAALDLFEERTGFIAAQGLDISQITFSARFTSKLDYYTGFVMEMYDGLSTSKKPLLSGGRYDTLLRQLGAPFPVPAVGFAIWLDRFNLDAISGEVL